MQTQLKKWGNSLALRIPSYLANELNMGENSLVEVLQEGDKLVVVPLKPRKKYTLQQLLEGVTEENLHKETETGAPVGDEQW